MSYLEFIYIISLFILFSSFRDAQREDVITLLFQIWLFSLATITVSRHTNVFTLSEPSKALERINPALGCGPVRTCPRRRVVLLSCIVDAVAEDGISESDCPRGL